MTTTLTPQELSQASQKVRTANETLMRRYPGESEKRQPVHTVYGGAHLFKATTISKLGQGALESFHTYAATPAILGEVIGLAGFDSASLVKQIHDRIEAKLVREAVEDFRIDFEDGYGNRPDTEEDATAISAAGQVALGMKQKSLSPFIGIRIKPFTEELKQRSFRTLDLFLTSLVKEAGGKLPSNFVVTLPKVTTPEQISTLIDLFEVFERSLKLPAQSLKMEFMIEVTQSILDPTGISPLPHFLKAARGRCTGAHFGTYDYTASCQITAAYQAMDHSVCDFAKHMMKVAYANTGIFISDGATNIMPVGPIRLQEGQAALAPEALAENTRVVHRAWRIAYDHIRHSLKNGFFQGWDLHPAQLPMRYAALYAFFLEGHDAASERLTNFIGKLAQATLVGDVFDDAATGQGLLNTFLRALNCGAITEDDILKTGLTLNEIRSRSFAEIVKGRRKTK